MHVTSKTKGLSIASHFLRSDMTPGPSGTPLAQRCVLWRSQGQQVLRDKREMSGVGWRKIVAPRHVNSSQYRETEVGAQGIPTTRRRRAQRQD